MRDFLQKQKQNAALSRLRNARAQVQARLKLKGGITNQKAANIAAQFSRQLFKGLAAGGKVQFERK